MYFTETPVYKWCREVSGKIQLVISEQVIGELVRHYGDNTDDSQESMISNDLSFFKILPVAGNGYIQRMAKIPGNQAKRKDAKDHIIRYSFLEFLKTVDSKDDVVLISNDKDNYSSNINELELKESLKEEVGDQFDITKLHFFLSPREFGETFGLGSYDKLPSREMPVPMKKKGITENAKVLKDMAHALVEDVKGYESISFLVVPAGKFVSITRKKIRECLGITKRKELELIKELKTAGRIVEGAGSAILFKEDALLMERLVEWLEKDGSQKLNYLRNSFTEFQDRKVIVKRLLDIDVLFSQQKPDLIKMIEGFFDNCFALGEKIITETESISVRVGELQCISLYAFKCYDRLNSLVLYLLNNDNMLEAESKDAGFMGKVEVRYSAVLEVLVDIMSNLKFRKTKEVLIFLMDIAKIEGAPITEIENVLKGLASYELDVVNTIGFKPQVELLEVFENLGDFDLGTRLSVLSGITGTIGEGLVQGTGVDYNKYTIRTFALKGDTVLKGIRSQALSKMFGLYNLGLGLDKRIQVIQEIIDAVEPERWKQIDEDPTIVEFKKSERELVFRYMLDEILPNSSFGIWREVRRRLEEFSPEDLGGLGEELVSYIDSNVEYKKYYEIFIPSFSWLRKDRGISHTETGDIQYQKIKDFASGFDQNVDGVFLDEIILDTHTCDKVETKRNLELFLHELAKVQPEIAFSLRQKNIRRLSTHFTRMLQGWETSGIAFVSEKINVAINEVGYCEPIAKYLFLSAYSDSFPIEIISNTAFEEKNLDAVNSLINWGLKNISTTMGYGNVNKGLAFFSKEEKSFIPYMYGVASISDTLENIDEASVDKILANLVYCNNLNGLDYGVMLEVLLKRYPQKLVPFLKSRIDRRFSLPIGRGTYYDVVPYSPYSLKKVVGISGVRKIFLDEIGNEIDGDGNETIYFKGLVRSFARLFQISEVSDDLYKKAIVEGMPYLVMAILTEYSNAGWQYDLIKAILIAFGDNHMIIDRMKRVFGGIISTSGLRGYEELLSQRIKRMKPWLQDGNPSVVDYAKIMIERRRSSVRLEKRRNDEEDALRKKGLSIKN